MRRKFGKAVSSIEVACASNTRGNIDMTPKNRGDMAAVAAKLCAQVVPVKIPGAITEPVDGTAGGGFLLDPSAVSFIEGLNLLRFT